MKLNWEYISYGILIVYFLILSPYLWKHRDIIAALTFVAVPCLALLYLVQHWVFG